MRHVQYYIVQCLGTNRHVSFIAVYKASVGSVIETAITALTPEQQMEVVKGLSRHLVNQGVVSPKVMLLPIHFQGHY